MPELFLQILRACTIGTVIPERDFGAGFYEHAVVEEAIVNLSGTCTPSKLSTASQFLNPMSSNETSAIGRFTA
jgi:hypothetical protein